MLPCRDLSRQRRVFDDSPCGALRLPQGTGCGKRVRCSRHLLPRGFRDVQYMPIVEAFGPERGSLSLDGLQFRVRGKKPPIAQLE